MKLTLRALLGRDELRLRLMNGDPDTPLTWVHAVAPKPITVPESHLGHARLDGDAAGALERARSAARAARRRGVPVVDGEAALDVVLAQPAIERVVDAWAGPVLQRLSDDGSESLRVTVTAFLRHGGSFDATARELKVHRHTVSSRVRRAQEAMGLDLADPDVRALLWLALAR